jgi:integrase
VPEDVLSHAEYHRTLTLMTRHLDRIALRLMAECGLRVGEVVASDVASVDRRRGLLLVHHRMVGSSRERGAKGTRVMGAPKLREVPLSRSLLDDLEPYLRDRGGSEPLLCPVMVGAGRLTRYSRDHFIRAVAAAQKVLKAQNDPLAHLSLHPHLFRHCYATWTAEHVYPTDLARLLGHADLRQIEQRYYHGRFAADRGLKAANAIAAVVDQALASAHHDNRPSDQLLSTTEHMGASGSDDAQDRIDGGLAA